MKKNFQIVLASSSASRKKIFKNIGFNFITRKPKVDEEKHQRTFKKKKYNIKIETFGIPALAGFNIKSKNFLYYKTLISQELLKDSILASNIIYLSTEHSDKNLNRYFKSLEKVFNLIAECENDRDINNLLEGPICHSTFERLN